MRFVPARFVSLRVGASGLVGVASLLAACVSSTPSSPTVDSGAPPVGDAGGPITDATVTPPGADAATDDAGATRDSSAPVDAAAAPLTVTVVLAATSAPESGVLVVFQDATGALLGTGTTDATGAVTQPVTQGMQVTVALGTALTPNLVTVQDVEPGDALTFTDGTASEGDGEEVSVTLPAPTWDASGAYEYVAAGRCTNSASFDLDVNPSCQQGGRFPLLAYAQGQGGVEVAYTYQADNALLDDGGSASITVARPWSTSNVTESITASALPAGFTGNVNYAYAEFSGGVASAILPVADTTPADGGAPISTFTVHPGYPDFVQTEAFAGFSQSSNVITGVAAAVRSAAPSSSQTAPLDLSPLPLFVSAAVDSTDAGTPTRPEAIWTSGGSLAGAAAVVVQMEWFVNPTDGGDQYVDGTWTILAPSTATRITAPAMSPGTALVPAGSAQFESPPAIAAVQGSITPGYASVRAAVGLFSRIPSQIGQTTFPMLPANGTLLITALAPNAG